MNLEDFSTTEISERALRRRAAAKNINISRNGDTYLVLGVPMTDDECWAVLESL